MNARFLALPPDTIEVIADYVGNCTLSVVCKHLWQLLSFRFLPSVCTVSDWNEFVSSCTMFTKDNVRSLQLFWDRKQDTPQPAHFGLHFASLKLFALQSLHLRFLSDGHNGTIIGPALRMLPSITELTVLTALVGWLEVALQNKPELVRLTFQYSVHGEMRWPGLYTQLYDEALINGDRGGAGLLHDHHLPKLKYLNIKLATNDISDDGANKLAERVNARPARLSIDQPQTLLVEHHELTLLQQLREFHLDFSQNGRLVAPLLLCDSLKLATQLRCCSLVLWGTGLTKEAVEVLSSSLSHLRENCKLRSIRLDFEYTPAAVTVDKPTRICLRSLTNSKSSITW
eukprot:TRINITY_DN112337_c0_g1_i1.p1 TRINITY_DN112337_c0_g1~~TRINITY_DN112337_c0_g1_i1.p1  ORF type:complete len:350 (-),score=7.58 TRINITY_DN112337_c0_g1_i1:122-1150(-)